MVMLMVQLVVRQVLQGNKPWYSGRREKSTLVLVLTGVVLVVVAAAAAVVVVVVVWRWRWRRRWQCSRNSCRSKEETRGGTANIRRR